MLVTEAATTCKLLPSCNACEISAAFRLTKAVVMLAVCDASPVMDPVRVCCPETSCC